MENISRLCPTYFRIPSLAAGQFGMQHWWVKRDVHRDSAKAQLQPRFPFQIQPIARVQRDRQPRHPHPRSRAGCGRPGCLANGGGSCSQHMGTRAPMSFPSNGF